jgi:hypothetical protein
VVRDVEDEEDDFEQFERLGKVRVQLQQRSGGP